MPNQTIKNNNDNSEIGIKKTPSLALFMFK